MKRAVASAGLSAAVSMALLSACTSTPPPAPAVLETPVAAPGVTASPASLAFERKQRDRALAQVRQGAWGEAALSWEILTVLRPGSAEYARRLDEARGQIEAGVADRLPRAAAAYKRGELDAATQQYLAVLALQPDQAQAAEALRAIERERVKRNNLGKLSRVTLTRRAVSDGLVNTPPAANDSIVPIATTNPPANAGPRDRNDIEHATLLADQGEFDEAIRLLERRLAAERRDARSRELLAEVYCRKGEGLLPGDKSGAVVAFGQCLRWRPGHPVATARLRELKSQTGTPAAPSAAASAPQRAAAGS